MVKPRQIRNLIFSLSLGAATGALAIAFMLVVVAAQTAQAQTFKVIHTFTGAQDGGNPYTGVTLDKAGNIYGTTYYYGAHGYGAVYELKLKNGNWTVSPLYGFTGGKDGANPWARVIFGPDGVLYGTTEYGGSSNVGVVFKLQPTPTRPPTPLTPWIETVLYSFKGGSNDGGYPGYGDLLFYQGNIYNTTVNGGHSNCGSGCGVVYELTPSGSGWLESVIYFFSGDDGAYPYSDVISDNAGNLYGTTVKGGLGNYGTVYELVPSMGSWTEYVLQSWNENPGSYPFAGVIFDQSYTNLYGATDNGGTGGGGTVFELTPLGNYNWKYEGPLYSFTGSNYCGPEWPLVWDGAGDLYGITYCDGTHGYGNVFELIPSNGGWTYKDLYDFTGGNDGKHPWGTVALDTNGNLYGTASAGGSTGVGVVWEITP